MVAQKKNVSKNLNKNESTPVVDINPIADTTSVDVTPVVNVESSVDLTVDTDMASVVSTTPVVDITSTTDNTPIVVQKAGAKKGKKNVVKSTEPAPVALATETVVSATVPVVLAETAETAETAKKATKVKKVKADTVPKVKADAAPKVKADAAPKVSKKVKNVKTDVVENGEVHDSENDTKTRSFKVQLPEEQEYTGRFTGLTPYQAANKALSKFFRNSDNTNISADHIVFSIKESSRGSKRSTYTYKGTRIKLEKAITYTIKSASGEERVITKQYKNQLIKIKKGVVAQTQDAVVSA
jgi:hypothetical protein